jgi:hypothetical protein
MVVTVEGGDDVLKLGMVVARQPQLLTCVGYVADGSYQPRPGIVAARGDLFTIADRDGAEVTVPFTFGVYGGGQGTLHLTIHQIPPDDQ